MKNFFQPGGACCGQIDRHFLRKFIFRAQWKTLSPKCKVSSHEMNPNFWFRQGGERFESQQVGGGGEVPRLENCIQHFCPLFPLLMDPPWSSLIIGDSLSLNGSPGLWPEKMQKCVDHTTLCHTVVEMVGDHCRPSYGHHQSKKLVKYKIKPKRLPL